MALIVEDGSGMSTAESYASVAEADSYFSKRNNADWDALDLPVKEACLRLATDYMVGTYRLRWKGRRRIIYQRLDWPRVGVVIEDLSGGYAGVRPYGLFQVSYQVVPDEIKNACAELALRASIGELAPDLDQRVVSESIGPLNVKYDVYSPRTKVYRAVDMMLKAFMMNSGNEATFKLTRI